MNFETWPVGLLAHAGFIFNNTRKEDPTYVKDNCKFHGCVTGQIKLTDRIALTGDFTIHS
jgi:OOP family OmpA-OmpF porin